MMALADTMVLLKESEQKNPLENMFVSCLEALAKVRDPQKKCGIKS